MNVYEINDIVKYVVAVDPRFVINDHLFSEIYVARKAGIAVFDIIGDAFVFNT